MPTSNRKAELMYHTLEFPNNTYRLRILRFFCPRHNKFATRAGLSKIGGVPTARYGPPTTSACRRVTDFSDTAPTLLPQPQDLSLKYQI
jgi:hypothetical protein